MPTDETAEILETSESRAMDGDSIVPRAQAAKLYRSKLKSHNQKHGLRLNKFLLGRRKYIRALDQIPRRKRAEDVDLMCRYYNGDQYGRYNEFGMYEDDRQDGDFAYTLPVLAGHVEQAFIQILKVRPKYEATADDKDNATMGLVASMCEDLGIKELDRVMEPVLHSELYNLVLSGDSVRFVGWDVDKVNPKTATRIKHTIQPVDLPARRECAQCKANVGDDETQCPKCGSAEITDIPAGTSNQMVPEPYEVELGQNVVRLPHMLAVQIDMSAIEPADSSFLVEYGYLDKHVMEWEYQSPINESSEGLPIEMQMRFDLERGSNQTDAIIGSARLASPGREGAFGATTHATGSAPRGKQPLERHYWDPSQYGQYVCQVDETLPDGTILKAGTVLGDRYPKGLIVVFGGDTILQMDPCIRRRKVTHIRYGRVAGTNSGAGLKKIMPLQNAENDNFNLGQTIKHTVGRPLTVLHGRWVHELPGPGNLLKVTNAGLDDVGKVVKQFPGQSMSQGDGAAQLIEGAMQFIAGTSTVGGGMAAGAPDMRAASTAHGVAAMVEQGADRQSGPVGQRIAADKELMFQLLENIQEYSTDEQKAELAKRFGKDVVKAFCSTKLRHSITIGIKNNTDLPRSMALTQANYIAFGQILGQIMPSLVEGNPMAHYVKEFLDDMATAMGFPSSLGEGRNDRREAGYRLNVLIEVEQQVIAENPELATDAIKCAAAMHEKMAQIFAPLIPNAEQEAQVDPTKMPPDEVTLARLFLQAHEVFMDVYKDALDSEPAKGWTDAHKLCVIQMFLDHLNALQAKKTVETEMQANMQQRLEPPPPPEATPPAQPTVAEQAALADQAHAHDIHGKVADHMAGEDAADAESQRRVIEDQAAHDRNVELEKIKQAGAAQPTAAPTGAAKIIESVKYPDLPAPAQKDLLEQAGLSTAGVAEKDKIVNAPPKPAAPAKK
jgi:hypothetical protein